MLLAYLAYWFSRSSRVSWSPVRSWQTTEKIEQFRLANHGHTKLRWENVEHYEARTRRVDSATTKVYQPG